MNTHTQAKPLTIEVPPYSIRVSVPASEIQHFRDLALRCGAESEAALFRKALTLLETLTDEIVLDVKLELKYRDGRKSVFNKALLFGNKG